MPSTASFDPTSGFAAYAIGARTNAAGAAVDDVNAEEARLPLALFTGGVLSADAFAVSQRAAGANMSVDVGSGVAQADRALLVGTESGQENIVVRLEDGTANVTLNAADLSNARIDQAYVYWADDAYDANGSLALPRLAVRTGDPAGSPTAPGPDSSWTAFLLLASIDVGAGVTSITDSDITDERVFTQPNVLGDLAVGGDLTVSGASFTTHADRHRSGGSDPLMLRIPSSSANTGTISTGDATLASVQVNVPTEWNSYYVEVKAEFEVRYATGGVATTDGTQYQFWFRGAGGIDHNTHQVTGAAMGLPGASGLPNSFVALHPHGERGFSGSGFTGLRTFLLLGKRLDGSSTENLEFRRASIWGTAYRLT